VPAMKLTFNAAMRARDVSRPREEDLAAAEAAEADAAGAAGGLRARPSPGDAAKPDPGRGRPKTTASPAGEPGATATDGARTRRPGFPRRRRSGRDGTRRG
jgi:hypothetical protein